MRNTYQLKYSKMKKKQILFLIAGIVLLIVSCNPGKKSDEVANYVYEEKTTVANHGLNKELGPWVKEDVICYGLVVVIDSTGTLKKGKPVKAKVVELAPNGVRMKALENVGLLEIKGCPKNGISRGEIWLETEGDLFQTKEGAETYLKKMNILME